MISFNNVYSQQNGNIGKESKFEGYVWFFCLVWSLRISLSNLVNILRILVFICLSFLLLLNSSQSTKRHIIVKENNIICGLLARIVKFMYQDIRFPDVVFLWRCLSSLCYSQVWLCFLLLFYQSSWIFRISNSEKTLIYRH